MNFVVFGPTMQDFGFLQLLALRALYLIVVKRKLLRIRNNIGFKQRLLSCKGCLFHAHVILALKVSLVHCARGLL
ncbi:hypothetical protein [Dyadobacter diqingensis]|uniref:hypothetical protein n=1 Tax=Dyadobacter diqingensis TaxID=2938121 RepID=UPI0020C2D500|nr:hypothetical protein [Dyadobacter diqingensis]